MDPGELLNVLHEPTLLLKIHPVAVARSQQEEETRKPTIQYAYMEEALLGVDVNAI